MATAVLTQQQLVNMLQRDQEHFRAIISSLDEEAQQQPFTREGWSIKDYISHMTFWKDETNKLLEASLHKQLLPPPVPTGDEANEIQRELDAGFSLQEVQANWDAVHARLLQLLRDELNDTLLGETIRVPWSETATERVCNLIAEMCDHDGEHFELIERHFQIGAS